MLAFLLIAKVGEKRAVLVADPDLHPGSQNEAQDAGQRWIQGIAPQTAA